MRQHHNPDEAISSSWEVLYETGDCFLSGLPRRGVRNREERSQRDVMGRLRSMLRISTLLAMSAITYSREGRVFPFPEGISLYNLGV